MTNTKKRTITSCLVVAGLMLSSCELLGPKHAPKLPLAPVAKEQTEVFDQLKNKPHTTEKTRGKSELFPGTNQFVPDTTTGHRKTKGSGEGSYSLNFDEADLGEVAKVVLSDILGQNYVLSPKVTGKVTLQTTDPLSKDELIPTLEMLLRMNNAVLIKDASIFHIEPASDALYSSSFGSMNALGFQVRVIPIRNVAVQDIVDVIKPLVQEKTILNVDATRNILIVSGTPDELARVMDMVSTFDTDVLKGRSFGLFPLAHTEPETIIKELEEIFNKKGGGDDNSFFSFVPIERLNAIMAITHQARYLNEIESWIVRLDRANTASGGGVNVYKVQHVNAVELADTLNNIFGSGGGGGKSAKLAPGKKSVQISNKTDTSTTTGSSGSSGKSGKSSTSSTSSTGTAKVGDVGDVKIIADEANNSVIIVATAQEYDVILPIIRQLDLLPLQVMIDATIAEVTLTDNLKYGIRWFFNAEGENTSGTGGDTTAQSLKEIAAGAAAAGTGGLSLLYNSSAVKALLSAQADKGNVNVISSPSLMVLNNQEAYIQVGTEISLATGQLGSLSNTSTVPAGSTNNVFSQQQQRKTGVKLKVKPRVNASGLVIMDIEQSVEDPGDPPKNGGNPSILTREITSSVAVQSGEVIVLGGLIKNNDTSNKSGVPFLHDLPWIGPLFGNTANNMIKTELVVLITPRVVGTRQDSRLITDEFKRKLTGIYEDKAVVSEGSTVVR